ncbi:sigma 54-interacting transcriptional regulator [Schnuerera sp. xch1]|uniref:sigma-54 interaction domain-containing protein n=1 Tax=Schnuerera sp. xch1 TaxID=2874283 RepID=UPI001CC109F5|nr:sigma 54-interacting transcriptional regulator [Schnuerera sp. xch1]MBZ2173688.1 sigma 54-interacting transcriptional regulator [Schnuerera sp. xch1]
MAKVNLNEVILQNILHYTDIGIHVINKDKKTIVYNEAMARLEGLDIEHVLNRDLLEVFPSLNEDTSTLIKVLMTKQQIIDETQSYINSKGKKIISINSTIPLFLNGEVVGALEIAKDITNLKNLSDKLVDLQKNIKILNNNDKISNNRINKYTFKDIIGKDEKIINAIQIARRAANSPSSVLIYGETGTGKELFAQSIHYSGKRSNKHFIAQNCASIPESLLEGILFGTEKGGFTGAIAREGIFEQANGGTLLLDEINSMSYGLQAKLLRVLQEGYIRRIGGIKDIPIDVKIIATTNEEPTKSIENGTLRKDLFFRLNVIYIKIPPLRERKKDILVLSKYLINKYNRILGRDIAGIDDDVLEAFYNYSWYGNVRELENCIEAAMNYAPGNRRFLQKEDFISSSNIFTNSNIFENPIIQDNEGDLDFKSRNKSLPLYLQNIEKKIIMRSLEENKFNITKAAKKLGIKRQTLQHKVKKYSLTAK